jgi:hypothetical protein
MRATDGYAHGWRGNTTDDDENFKVRRPGLIRGIASPSVGIILFAFDGQDTEHLWQKQVLENLHADLQSRNSPINSKYRFRWAIPVAFRPGSVENGNNEARGPIHIESAAAYWLANGSRPDRL